MIKLPSSGRSIVGLDIEPSYVAAAEVRVNGTVSLERAASTRLEPGLMRDGEVTDAEGLAEALRDFVRENKLGRRVRLGVANQRIVVRTLDLPPLENRKELAAAVRFQAQEQVPMPLDQAVLDFQPLGIVDTPEGKRARVVIVAARREMLERLLNATRRAGLRPEGIDLSAFAMIRALGPGPTGHKDAVLYVHVGGMTNLALAEGNTCLFTRVAAGGQESMVAELADRRGLTLEHSRQWLTHVGLAAPVEEIEGDPEIVQDARSVLSDGARRIADEVRNSLDFYRAQSEAYVVTRALLTGPAVAINGLSAQLESELGLPVEPGVVAEGRPGALGDIEAGRLTVAAGLAFPERVS